MSLSAPYNFLSAFFPYSILTPALSLHNHSYCSLQRQSFGAETSTDINPEMNAQYLCSSVGRASDEMPLIGFIVSLLNIS